MTPNEIQAGKRYINTKCPDAQYEGVVNPYKGGDPLLKIVKSSRKDLVGNFVVFDSTDTKSWEFWGAFELETPPLKVGHHDVRDITTTGFYVGCEYVSWGIFDAIAKIRRSRIL